MRRNTIFSILLFLIAGILSMSAEKVKLATLDWEPYIGQNIKNQGYVAEVVKEAFKRSGYEVEYTFLPWARVVKMAEQGEFDGYFPEYYSESLKENFHVSQKFLGGPLGFFRKKGSTIRYETLEDLKPFRIGVVRGYINTKEFDEAEYLNKDDVTTDLQNIKKLLKGRIDLMVADKFVGYYILGKEMPNEMADAMEFLDPPLEEKDLYVCFGKNVANSKKLLDAFNKGLKSMQEDGTFEEILRRNGF